MKKNPFFPAAVLALAVLVLTQCKAKANVPDTFVFVPGATFTMGSPVDEPGRESDETQHRVTVKSFYMGKYTVTQQEYSGIMSSNPSHFVEPDLPVEQVSWFDAIEYCNRLSVKERLTPAYTVTGSGKGMKVTWNRNADGYRLPTEAEWEYACRAGTATPFNTGTDITTEQANFKGNVNDAGKTTKPGSFEANQFGLYDMHGNVFEWCWDRYEFFDAAVQTNPAGPDSGDYRVARGGAWNIDWWNIRSAYRFSYNPHERSGYQIYIGFRLVRS